MFKVNYDIDGKLKVDPSYIKWHDKYYEMHWNGILKIYIYVLKVY